MMTSSQEILTKLLRIGFLTGSRAYGTSKEDSDWDIVYPIDKSDEVKSIISGYEETSSAYFSGKYITVGRKKINLIPVHPHDYLPWYLATKAMTATLKLSGIDEPINKYAVFMGIVSLYKGVVEKHKTISGYIPMRREIRRDSKANIPYDDIMDEEVTDEEVTDDELAF